MVVYLSKSLRTLCKLTLSSTFGFSLGFPRPFISRNFKHLNFFTCFFIILSAKYYYICVGEISKQVDK